MQPEPVGAQAPDAVDPYEEGDDLRDAATASPLANPRGVGPAPTRRQAFDRPPPLPSVYPGTNTPVAPAAADPKSAPAAAEEANGASLAGEHPLVRELLLTPGHWHTWPAVAVLRWMLRQTASADTHRLVYRSKPSLDFPPGEVDEVELTGSGVVGLTLRAPGIAAPGSPLPTSDILRIIQDMRRGGALAPWLDGFGNRFMQAVETAQAQNNAAFALAIGGEIPTLRAVSNLVGRSAPLASDDAGSLDSTWNKAPRGALGLAPFFLGGVSAAGLTDLFAAFTGKGARVVEFAGSEVAVARPARIGVGAFGAVLGTRCRLASAGVDVVLEGGDDAASLKWASEPPRRRSLYDLATSYIGSPSPAARCYLEVDGAVVPPAALDIAELGGVAVLGRSTDPVRLPLANG